MCNHVFRTAPAVAVLLAIGAAGATACAQRVSISAQHHAWGRFYPGSWTQLRKVTEELDSDGNVRNTIVTETTTTLIETDTEGYELLVEVTSDVGGRRIETPKKTISLGYNGQAANETATLRRTGQDAIEIAGQELVCTTIESVFQGSDSKTIGTIHYSDRFAPHIMRRDTQTFDNDGKPTGRRTRTDVLALQMPYKVLQDIRTASYIRNVRTHANGSTFTMEVHCEDVPGGVVALTSKEMDENDNLVRRSTLELVDYGIAAPQQVGRLMSLREKIRQHRARRAYYRRSP